MKMMSSLTAHSQLPPEQEAIRAKCFHPSGTFVEFKAEEIEQSIPQRFEKIVRQYPKRLAVTTWARPQGLTYEEINEAANRIARALLDRCGERNEPVPILVEEDEKVIAAILGVLKAGKIYVPLDASLPIEGITSVLEDCQASCLITDQPRQLVDRSFWKNRCKLIHLQELDSHLSGSNLGLAIPPDTLAFILYTSGSTGIPKGVVQNQRNILHAIRAYANDIHICPDDRLSLLFSLSFHGSVRNLLGALLNGASVHRFDPKKESLQDLIAWMTGQEITIYHSTATLFRSYAPMLSGKEQFPHLRIVQLAAEAVVARDIKLFKRFFPPTCIFANRLGTTETGTYLRYQVDTDTPLDGGASVPVGYPVEGMRVSLVNEAGEAIGCNEAGEIAVKSRYLSLGYWRKPELTQEKFLPDLQGGDERTYLTGDMGRMDVHGCFFHLGRKDFQVKIRGFRVGIGDIETILLNHPGIKEIAVVSLQTQSGDTRLVAYFVAAAQPVPSVSEIRRFLKERLPEYMIPSTFILLDRMPITANGKIDRQALPALTNIRPELGAPYVGPRTPLEENLAEIWARVLNLDRVGIHDNFFDLGGHSLAAAQIVAQVIKKFQIEIPLQSLFQSPTIAEMARVITENQAKKLNEADLNRMLADLESLSDEQAREVVANDLSRDREASSNNCDFLALNETKPRK